jgi:hypothetical protein
MLRARLRFETLQHLYEAAAGRSPRVDPGPAEILCPIRTRIAPAYATARQSYLCHRNGHRYGAVNDLWRTGPADTYPDHSDDRPSRVADRPELVELDRGVWMLPDLWRTPHVPNVGFVPQGAWGSCHGPPRGRMLASDMPIAGNPGDGHGWFRTSDLSRVKRALSH